METQEGRPFSPTRVAATTRDKSTAAPPRRAEREAVLEAGGLRKENRAPRRQSTEPQGRERVLKQELGETRTETSFAKPHEAVTDQDHEKVMAFITKHGLDPGKDYDRALMFFFFFFVAKGEIKLRRKEGDLKSWLNR